MEFLPNSGCSSTSKVRLSSAISTAAIIVSLSLSLGLGSAQAAGLASTPFPPDYPAGPSYDTFAATLEGFGLITDADGDGLQNDRCSADGEAAQQIVLATELVLLIHGHAGTPSPGWPIPGY